MGATAAKILMFTRKLHNFLNIQTINKGNGSYIMNPWVQNSETNMNAFL